jgi:alkylation response protein AidB-like acyl-CoA dehydrogenase
VRGLEREGEVLARLDAAMASWWAWAKEEEHAGAAAGRCAVLRQRMADVLIEHTVAVAVLAEAKAGVGTGGQEQARLLRDRVGRCLRLAEEEIGRSRGTGEVAWMRQELEARRQEEREAGGRNARARASSSPGCEAEVGGGAHRRGRVVRSADEGGGGGGQGFAIEEWRRFCREVVRPAAQVADRAEHVSDELWEALSQRGYLQLFHQAAMDDEAAPSALYPAMLALAEACAATFWKATISSALCGKMISSFAQPEVAARWLPGLASGRWVGVFAASERGSGSDPRSYAARLCRRGRGWVLSGAKDRISNAGEAEVAAVLCPAFEENGDALGLALAVVELDAGGVERTRYGTMGLRGMSFGRLGFDEVALPEDAVTLGTAMPRILTVVEWGQVVQALCGLGLGRAALDEAEHFLAERGSFGRPLAQHPAVRAQLEEARLELAAGAALARRAVAKKANGEVAGESIVAAKIFCSEAGLAACQVALRVCGGWGYTTELAVERMVRDAHGNVPAGLPNDRLRELLIASRVGVDPWEHEAR